MAVTKEVKHWAFYAFANHSYQTVYVSFLLPVFFSVALARQGYSLSEWGAAAGISTAIGIVLAVLVGRYSDRHGKIKLFRAAVIASFLGMVIVALGSQYFISPLLIIFVITNSVFICSASLSDSILPHVSNNATSYEYGGFSWGFGYLGGVLSLIIVLVFQHLTGNYSLWVFMSVPVFYILFSWYSLSGLANITTSAQAGASLRSSTGQKRVFLSRNKKIVLFVGYWFISECVTVIVLFASLYLSEQLHFSTIQIGVTLIIIQLIGFPATWYGGKMVKRGNALRLLGISIIFWGIALFTLIVLHLGLVGLAITAVFVGFAIGNSQSYLRSQYATLVDQKDSGYQFGFYSLISESAVFVGPIIYGYASDKLHSQNIPLFGLFAFMVVGYWLIWSVTHKMPAQS